MTYIGTNTIGDAKNELAAMMHGSTIKQIQNIDAVFNRGARRVVTDVDPWETKMNIEMGAVYDNVFDYACPIDLKGNKIIDIHPQVVRSLLDNYGQSYNKDFDIQKQYPTTSKFSIMVNNGKRTLHIKTANMFSSIPVSYMNQMSSYAVWDGAENLRIDNLYRTLNTQSSLAFDLIAGQTTGYIENALLDSLDLTAHLNQAMEFVFVWMPDPTAISTIELRFGSDIDNYWEQSVTTQYNGEVFQTGWNLLGFKWSTATAVGTPDVTKMSYMRLTLTYDGKAQTSIRVNDYESRLGQILMLEYYSKYLFRNDAGVMQETVQADTDYVQLDTDSYDLVLMATASEAVQQMQGLDALFFDNNHFAERYMNSLAEYKSKYKSEITKPKQVYYKMPNPNRLQWLGRKWSQ